MELFKKYSFVILSGLLVGISFLIFWEIIHKNIPTDLQTHSLYLIKYVQAGAFPVPPLYYFALYVLSGFSTSIIFVNQVAICFLAFCMFLKYYYSCRLIQDCFIKPASKILQTEIHLLAFLALFFSPMVYSLAQQNFYIGKLASNVWHNSTSIAVMPFVILLYQQSLKFINAVQISIRNVCYILIFSTVNLLIKPSFLFAFVPAFSLILLLKFGLKTQKFWVGIGIAFVIFLTIIIEYYIVYRLDLHHRVLGQAPSTIVFKPFYFFALYSKNISLDFLLSLLFPVLCIVFFPKEIGANTALQFILCLFACAFVIATTLAEAGSRAGHGNFVWQIILVNYLLVLGFATFAYEKIKERGYGHYQSIVLMGVFLWHVCSGWIYIHHLITAKTFF